MEYTELGSTGVNVSVMSLGAGGPSKLGLNRGKSKTDARRIVETALDRRINLIDTAEAYGTEEVVGNAIQGTAREDVVLSTKFSLYDDGDLRSPDELEKSVAKSLERLNTKYVDIYHLHGVTPEEYEYAAEQLQPRLERLKDEGTIRFIGITESVSADPGHEMLARAVDTDLWDVVMVGFNLLNQSARDRVLEPAANKGIGTIGMVPVRRALSNPDVLEETIQELIAAGEFDPEEIDPQDPFGFLIHDEGATDLVEAAYRFCRYEPTIDTVLTGTSRRDHLVANIESVSKGPLPEEDLSLVRERFGHIDSVIGN